MADVELARQGIGIQNAAGRQRAAQDGIFDRPGNPVGEGFCFQVRKGIFQFLTDPSVDMRSRLILYDIITTCAQSIPTPLGCLIGIFND